MFLLILLVSFLLSFVKLSESQFVCHPNDKNALLKIKANFANNSSSLSSWDPNINCCYWTYVGCDEDGRVVILAVNDAVDVVGRLSPDIGNLRYLQALRFWNMPNLTGPIPSTIAKLTSLLILDFSSNNMYGRIPDALSNLKNLEQLDLSSNKFSGSIPNIFGNLINLEHLSLASNKLSGSIPSSLSMPTKLRTLVISGNRLTGSIPVSFGSFKANISVQLFDNRLSGPIPKSLGKANLITLDVSKNELTGDASFLFGKDKPLSNISIRSNKFKFDFSNVDLPQGLRDIDIAHNMIYGSIPKRIGQLPLQSIDVSYNHLCGKIPTGRRLKRFSPSLFAYNKCLCGVPLPPCK